MLFLPAFALPCNNRNSSIVAKIKMGDTLITWTSLHSAVHRGRLRDVARILEGDNVVVDGVASNGDTPFAIACRGRNLRIVRALLQAGADAKQTFKKPNGEETTAAIEACETGDEMMVELLLGFGVSANDKCNKVYQGGELSYLLSVAVKSGKVRRLRVCLNFE